jgi:protocatechuate 3,4-dioxygenase beta subunit
MRRTTLILTILAVATAGIVSWVIFSPDDKLTTHPGDTGVVQTPKSTDGEASAADQDAAAKKALAGAGETASADRTELASTPDPATAAAAPRTGALTLRVLDPEGQPIEGLNARIMQSGGAQFVPWMDPGTKAEALVEMPSNGNGEIELLGVPAETQISLAISGDHWVERKVPLAALRNGERRALGDLSIARGVLLLGRVLGEDNKPVVEAKVVVAERSGSAMPGGIMLGGMEGGTQRRVETDTEGRFRIPGLAPKEYTATATQVGRVQAETDVLLSLSNPDHRVELRMSDGGWITGVVRAEDGRPIPEAKVALIPARGFASYQWDSERVLRDGQSVGEDGSFRLAGVPEDNSHRVVATAPGFARGRSDRVVPGMKIEIGLAPRVTLAGFVFDSTGSPVAEAEITATPTITPGAGNQPGFNQESALSDENGAFEFGELSAGTYDFAVSSPAGETTLKAIEVNASSEAIELRLPAGDAVIVRVTDTDGQALEDASVSIETSAPGDDLALLGGNGRRIRMSVSSEGTIETFGGGASRKGRTDAGGILRFHGLPQGKYSLTVNKEGFARTIQIVERNEDGEQLVIVEVPRAAAVRVSAVDANGLPIEGANLEIARVDAKPADTHTAKTDAWGLVVFRDLVPGIYTLRESASAQQNGGFMFFNGEETAEEVPQEETVRFELGAGEDSDQQIMLAAKAVPTVLVTRLGVPVPNANVMLESMGSSGGLMAFNFPGMSGGTTTNARGLATLPPNDPGGYLLKARATATNPYSELEVTLGPGAQQLTIELATGGVSGTITGSGGPLVDAQVNLNRERGEGNVSSGHSVGVISFAIGGADDDEGEVETFDFSSADARARTDSDGRFRFLDVPPGTYTMSIKAKGHSPLTTEIFVVDQGTQGDRGIIALQAGASLKGKIMNLPNASGDQPFYSLVRLEDADGKNKGYCSVRSNGNYKFDELEPGSYRLVVNLPDGDDRISDLISVQAGAPTNFDFPL